PGAASTANGVVQTWNLSLDSVQVQGITLYNVSASVIEAPLNTILLGNSFLNRLQMQRAGETMVLVRRF
ncbi:MAG: TIGR02281 family clan AA aspartic protease, partial [Burkholderiales bacterium]